LEVVRVSVEAFRDYYESIGRKNARTYYFLLKGFEKWLAQRGKSIDDFSPADAEMYMAELAKGSPRTANVFLAAVRRYAEWRTNLAVDDNEFVREQRRWMALKMIRPRKVAREIKKEALTEEELERLIEVTMFKYELFVATAVHFYFGWRPVEGAKLIREARIDWGKDYMIIRTAKVGDERILPWAPMMRPIIKRWYEFANTYLAKLSRPEEWYTKAIKPVAARIGLKVTARTARKTFETQMRARGVEQWAINFLLGHTTTIPDVYTDWGVLTEYLREIMVEKHYLLPILEEVMGKWRGRMVRR
jgi:site-specific recombinase XerD